MAEETTGRDASPERILAELEAQLGGTVAEDEFPWYYEVATGEEDDDPDFEDEEDSFHGKHSVR